MASSFNMMLSHSGHCAEAGEARYCEPYLLVTSIDLRSPHPDVEAFLYGPWERATSRDTADVAPLVWRESFWRLDIIAAPIANPDDVIFLVALMEHVNGNPSAVRILVKKAVIEALGASAGMAREPRIAKLISDTNRAVDLANGGPQHKLGDRASSDGRRCGAFGYKWHSQVRPLLCGLWRRLLPEFLN
jgi:hypothetical protein